MGRNADPTCGACSRSWLDAHLDQNAKLLKDAAAKVG